MKERKTATPGEPAEADATKRKKAGLSREIQSKIGRQLRAYYGGLIEPTPGRFIEILRPLDQKEREDEGSSG
jgi:hypothetical protein